MSDLRVIRVYGIGGVMEATMIYDKEHGIDMPLQAKIVTRITITSLTAEQGEEEGA